MADPLRRGLYFPLFGELAAPSVAVEVAVAAEAAGWDGLFVWDHVLRPVDEPNTILDPWVVLGAIAAATTRLRIGTMVTPIVRRRPIKLAREVMTLDLLSAGRATLGLGLGVDRGGELSRFGEPADPHVRGRLLDEGAGLLDVLLRGETVNHDGAFFRVDDVRLEPGCVQSPRVPFWCAARGDALRPARRAARYEGLFPIEVDRSRLGRMLEAVAGVRGGLDGFDVAVNWFPGVDVGALLDLGVTWVLTGFAPDVARDDLLAVATSRPEPEWER